MFWLSLVSPMHMITSCPLLIHVRDMSQIPLLLMGIHGIGLTTALLMTPTIVTTMVVIARALVAMTMTLGYRILGIWITSALPSKERGLPQ